MTSIYDILIAIILLVLFILLLPIIIATMFFITEKILNPFWEWYCNILEEIWSKLKGDDGND